MSLFGCLALDLFLTYFSDFYLSPRQRRDIIGLRVNKNVPLGKYDVKIFAYDSFEKRTLNFINDTIILE